MKSAKLQTLILSAALTACATLVAAPIAAEDACPLSYDQYEVSVPHTDLEECPASLNIEGAYCQLTVNMEIATVFAFSDTDDCIVMTRAYHDDEYTLTLE